MIKNNKVEINKIIINNNNRIFSLFIKKISKGSLHIKIGSGISTTTSSIDRYTKYNSSSFISFQSRVYVFRINTVDCFAVNALWKFAIGFGVYFMQRILSKIKF